MMVTGDVHGTIDATKLDKLAAAILEDDIRFPDGRKGIKYMLIAGDFGSIWKSYWRLPGKQRGRLPVLHPEDLQKIHNIYDYFPWTTLWIDGNHENHDVLGNLDVEERWGGKVSVLTDKCIYLHRGQVFTIDGITFLTMGGAYSVDKYRRVKGQSWWPQETITEADYNEAIKNLAKVNNKVDFVISHTCPSSALKMLEMRLPEYKVDYWGPKANDPSCDWLEKIRQVVDTKHWVFGHYHVDETFESNGIIYRAKYDNFWDVIPTITKLHKEQEEEATKLKAIQAKEEEERRDNEELLLKLYNMEFG